ncbi:MAG TPA: phenylalanine--tRNA ligase subunit beta [Tepidisphaeraceae bacterium]|nr:phenylalanine--tRNA ligase subunit beta [Tepidisphaeraceae bacterium]
MLVPLTWLREYIDIDVPTSELAERLSLAGMEVEGIEKAGNDEVLNIAITPDAARCLSVIGVAREVAAILGKSIKLPPDEFPAGGEERADQLVDVSIEDPNLCQRYIGVVVKGVQIRESPAWMKDRLERAGVRAVNNVVDVTNYVMLEWGQPLHAFDYQKLKSRAGSEKPKVIVRPAKSGEKMKTLDAAERNLNPSMLMICDSRGPIAVAGVMGGADSEVSSQTRDILIEAATFDKTSVRRTAQKLKMSTESSFRFTRGIPSRLPEIAARRAAKLIAELGGGNIAAGIVDQYPVPQEAVTVYLTASQVKRTLGVELSLDEIAKTLSRLEFVIENRASVPSDAGAGAMALFADPKEDVLKCAVPWYRLDVRIPADLTEEIARLRGFDSIGMTQLSEPLGRPHRNLINETEEKLRDILVGCGFQETINYSLTTPQMHEKLGLASESTKYVTLANAMSVDRTVMRRSMIVSAIEGLAYNARFAERLATFEVGRIYLPEQSEDGIRPKEDRRVSLLMCGARRTVNFNSDPSGTEEMDFFDLKGVIESLLARAGVKEDRIRFESHRQPGTFTPRCARVMIGEKELGVFGEINPAILRELGIKSNRVAVAELRITPLIPGEWDWSRSTTVNKFPAVIEDLAFVVEENIGAGTLRRAIVRTGGQRVVDVELFDVFRGPALGAGKKSLAFRVSYQDANAAIANEEVVSLREKIVQAIASEFGGVLRAV